QAGVHQVEFPLGPGVGRHVVAPHLHPWAGGRRLGPRHAAVGGPAGPPAPPRGARRPPPRPTTRRCRWPGRTPRAPPGRPRSAPPTTRPPSPPNNANPGPVRAPPYGG